MTDFLHCGQAQAPQLDIANGERNKLAHHDRPFHDWYRFVLSYPAHLVRQYLEEFNLDKDDIVLDPFCGTGTTIVESQLSNVKSLGIEANRFAHFASSVKVDWDVDSEAMLDAANRINDRATSALNKFGISDEPEQHILVPSNLRGFLPEQEKIILHGSMSPIPLHKAMVLLDEINRYKKMTFFDHLRLAFAPKAECRHQDAEQSRSIRGWRRPFTPEFVA